MATMDFEFLSQNRTVEWIRENPTLFILRGIPGSGKTTLAKALKTVYRENVWITGWHDFVITNSNHFSHNGYISYIDKNHKNQFIEWLIKNMEMKMNSSRIVVFDACFESSDAIRRIGSIAQMKYSFHVIVCSPRTPWANDPYKCHAINSHNVDLQEIKQIHNLIVSNSINANYTGWFFTNNDGQKLTQTAALLWSQLVGDSQTLPFITKYYSTTAKSVTEYYSISIPTSSLHVTAKHCSKPGFQNYMSHPHVVRSFGNLHTMVVKGIVFSPRTCSGIISLPDSALEKKSPETSEPGLSLWLEDDSNGDDDTIAMGGRAHVTLFHHESVTPRVAGVDMSEVKNLFADSSLKKTFRQSHWGISYLLGEGYIVCAFGQSVSCPTLFLSRW